MILPALALLGQSAPTSDGLEAQYQLHLKCYHQMVVSNAVLLTRKIIDDREIKDSLRFIGGLVAIAKKQGKSSDEVVSDIERVPEDDGQNSVGMTDQEVREKYALSAECADLFNQLNGAEK